MCVVLLNYYFTQLYEEEIEENQQLLQLLYNFFTTSLQLFYNFSYNFLTAISLLLVILFDFDNGTFLLTEFREYFLQFGNSRDTHSSIICARLRDTKLLELFLDSQDVSLVISASARPGFRNSNPICSCHPELNEFACLFRLFAIRLYHFGLCRIGGDWGRGWWLRHRGLFFVLLV
jgi:hypothetical protein